MSDDLIRALAIAYAQTKLIQYQREHPENSFCDDEIRLFLKAYDYAGYQIPIEHKDFDEHF